MAFNPNMPQAQPGTTASSANYNGLISNILDLDTRATAAQSTANTANSTANGAVSVNNTQNTRLTALETFEDNMNAAVTALDTRTTKLENLPFSEAIRTSDYTWVPTGTGGVDDGGIYLPFQAAPDNNPGTMWTSGAADRITIPEAGVYEVFLQVAYTMSIQPTAGMLGIYITLNGGGGTTGITGQEIDPRYPATIGVITMTGRKRLAANDFVQLRLYRTVDNTTFTFKTTYGGTFLSVMKVRN